jgi:hypothetical protein
VRVRYRGGVDVDADIAGVGVGQEGDVQGGPDGRPERAHPGDLAAGHVHRLRNARYVARHEVRVLEDPGHVADGQQIEDSGDRAGDRKRRLLACRLGQPVQQAHPGGWVRFPDRHGQPHQGDLVAPASVLRGPQADRDDGSQVLDGRAVVLVIPA